jgi:L-amino acid N-acyltransferase YncA
VGRGARVAAARRRERRRGGRLIARAEADGYWTLLAGVFPENEPSLALHTSLGFRVVGVHARLGQVGGVWRDVTLLERRSI